MRNKKTLSSTPNVLSFIREKSPSNKRTLLLFLLAIATLSAFVARQAGATIFPISITLTGTVNGHPVNATGVATLNDDTGAVSGDFSPLAIDTIFDEQQVASKLSIVCSINPPQKPPPKPKKPKALLELTGGSFSQISQYDFDTGESLLLVYNVTKIQGTSGTRFVIAISENGSLPSVRPNDVVINLPYTVTWSQAAPGKVVMRSERSITVNGEIRRLTVSSTVTYSGSNTLPCEQQILEVHDILTSVNSQTSTLHLQLVSNLDCLELAPPFGAPTLSDWGKIIMVLLLLTAGTIVIQRRSPLLASSAATRGSGYFFETISRPLFVAKLFGGVLAGILALVLIGFAVLTWLSSPIELLDIGGTLLCALMLAYLVHLVILTAKDSQTNR